eukprot:scaffold26764_cov79-Isochrysis_galbana.AAC.1
MAAGPARSAVDDLLAKPATEALLPRTLSAIGVGLGASPASGAASVTGLGSSDSTASSTGLVLGGPSSITETTAGSSAPTAVAAATADEVGTVCPLEISAAELQPLFAQIAACVAPASRSLFGQAGAGGDGGWGGGGDV